MKKSEIYHLAQIAVITSPCITPENKLEILHVLMMDEDLELYSENKEFEKTMQNIATYQTTEVKE